MSAPQTIFSIQLLRGVAALLVLVEHLLIESHLPAYGAVGVDLFFVISGFIIYFVTQADQRHFFLKRIIRIVPLYWLATGAIAVITLLKPSLFNSASFSLSHFVQSLFFLPHYTEAQGLRPLLALGWTLNFEMMFYLIFVVAMAVSHRWRAEFAALGLALLWALGAVLDLPQTIGFSFYNNAILFEFVLGLMIARHHARLRLPNPALAQLAFLVALIIFCLVTLLRPSGIRLFDNGLPASLLFIALLLLEAEFQKRPTLRRVALLGGEISYSLYLSHIYIMALLSRFFHFQAVSLWVVCFVVIPVCAWLIYRFIEYPLTQLLRRRILPR